MHRHLLAIALVSTALACTGCRQDTPTPAPAAAAPAAEPEIRSAVISEVDHNSPASAAPGFDAKAFAGIYAGTLPCVECPGIDTSIAFTAEGGYTLGETYQDGSGGNVVTKGTWTVRDDGKTLLLDPEDKDENDRWFVVVSPTELHALDREGKAIASSLDNSLRRK